MQALPGGDISKLMKGTGFMLSLRSQLYENLSIVIEGLCDKHFGFGFY